MSNLEIFQLTLNLSSPWSVGSAEFLEGDNGKQELDIRIDFSREYVFDNGDKL